MLPRLRPSLMLSFFIAILFSPPVSASQLPDEAFQVKVLEVPTIFRTGAGLACSIGASAAFVASAFIIAHSYQSYRREKDTLKEKSYTPPRAFFWSMASGVGFIAALFALTETAWAKQT